jgi:hypothetical protein
MMIIQIISRVTHYYHLEFQREQIDFSTLVNIISSLSELDSLKIHSLSLSPPKSLSIEKAFHRFLSNTNKITKVCLEYLVEMEEVYFLIKLCPRMNYLEVNCITRMDVEFFVCGILTKINDNGNQNLRSLCFGLSTADNKIIGKLKEMINSNKLLHRYTIKREFDNIYLQWENSYHQDFIST